MLKTGSKIKILDAYGECIVQEATITLVLKKRGLVYVKERINGHEIIYGLPLCTVEEIPVNTFIPTLNEVTGALHQTI